jgi:hypothetical protein
MFQFFIFFIFLLTNVVYLLLPALFFQSICNWCPSQLEEKLNHLNSHEKCSSHGFRILRYIQVVSWFDIELNLNWYKSLLYIYLGHKSHHEFQFIIDLLWWIMINNFKEMLPKFSVVNCFFLSCLYSQQLFFLHLTWILNYLMFVFDQLVILLCHSFYLKCCIFIGNISYDS